VLTVVTLHQHWVTASSSGVWRGTALFSGSMLWCLQYKKDCRLTIDLLETDGSLGAEHSEQKWSAYIDRFVSNDDSTNVVSDTCHQPVSLSRQPVLLHRSASLTVHTCSWITSCFVSSDIYTPLGVHSTKRRHQSPEWTVLSHVSSLIQGEVIGFQVLLDSLHPRSTRASWWSPPVLWGNC